MDLSVVIDRSMAAASPAPFFVMREKDHNQSASSLSSLTAPAEPAAAAAAPAKKRRNLPGTPSKYPDAEVVALSPRTLMATNRFVCEVCNKGFQREQNLQLHRRGHNLPWKLKQKSSKEAPPRRKVYLCPEPGCAHHEPSRALGDLTGIKKHFSRKHGEKKWKCDKCAKRYAVQSDWKAHSKTCGTREYRCDCGTLFSRRDSFITHRAFCDALAQESARLPPGLASLGGHLYGGGTGLGPSQLVHPSAADLLRLGAGGGGSQFDTSLVRPPSSPFFLGDAQSTHHPLLSAGLLQPPDLQSNANLFNLGFFSSGGGASDEQAAGGTPFSTGGLSSLFGSSIHENHHPDGSVGLPQMSATALLQKAAQMGSTSSTRIHDLMSSLAGGNAGIFGGFNAGGGGMSSGIGGTDGLTRDFLGLGSMVRMSQREQRHHGIDVGPMEPELEFFPGGSM